MYWIIDQVHKFENAQEAAEYITENMDDNVYDEVLDECYEEINICGLYYNASLALFQVDPVAYECGKNDYYNSLCSDIVRDLERMDNGDVDNYYDFEVEAVEDEVEDEVENEVEDEVEEGSNTK